MHFDAPSACYAGSFPNSSKRDPGYAIATFDRCRAVRARRHPRFLPCARRSGEAMQLAWSGAQPAAPAECDYVWFKQALDGHMRVGAVRLVFRRENGSFTAGGVALLKTAQ